MVRRISFLTSRSGRFFSRDSKGVRNEWHCRDRVSIGATNLIGRMLMKTVDCPFHAADRELAAFDPTVKVKLVDFHPEATSDKQLMGCHLDFYFDCRVSAVLGTHTHVATADDPILRCGNCFQCDVGTTAPFDSRLGHKAAAVMEATLHGAPDAFQVAVGEVRLYGSWVDVNIVTGLCEAIGRINVREDRSYPNLQGARTRHSQSALGLQWSHIHVDQNVSKGMRNYKRP